MSKRRRDVKPDAELESAVQSALALGIPLSRICLHAQVDQSTLFKWRKQLSSPTMSTRQAVLDAIEELIAEVSQ